jgi:hypothetical protein
MGKSIEVPFLTHSVINRPIQLVSNAVTVSATFPKCGINLRVARIAGEWIPRNITVNQAVHPSGVRKLVAIGMQ